MHRHGRILKILKIAVGSMLAMAAAQALGLRYSSSAGVITLLSIQDTKRETIRVTGRRFLAFLAVSGFPGGNGPGAGILCIDRAPAFGNGDFSSDVYPAVYEMGHTGGDIREHGPDDPYSG